MSDRVRVLRVIEYVGDREAVEFQVRKSLHGEKSIEFTGGAWDASGDPSPRGKTVTIKASTIGVYPEVLEQITSTIDTHFRVEN